MQGESIDILPPWPQTCVYYFLHFGVTLKELALYVLPLVWPVDRPHVLPVAAAACVVKALSLRGRPEESDTFQQGGRGSHRFRLQADKGVLLKELAVHLKTGATLQFCACAGKCHWRAEF